MARKAKQPGLNKALTPEELDHKRVLAERYELPIGPEEEVDVEAARKAWEAEERKREAARLEAIEEGKRQRFGAEGRVGANEAVIAGKLASRAKLEPELTPAQVERRRQADIAMARAIRYGDVVVMGSNMPSATSEEIAERAGAWDQH